MMVTPEDDEQPKLAIRRHHDRCFHPVEEVVPEGYIVQGVLIDHDEVAQVVSMDTADGTAILPTCKPSRKASSPDRPSPPVP